MQIPFVTCDAPQGRDRYVVVHHGTHTCVLRAGVHSFKLTPSGSDQDHHDFVDAVSLDFVGKYGAISKPISTCPHHHQRQQQKQPRARAQS
jgi:hypothetical protein